MSKFKKVCFKCGYFDKEMRSHYKCCVAGTCPAKDWNDVKIRMVIRRGYYGKIDRRNG